MIKKRFYQKIVCIFFIGMLCPVFLFNATLSAQEETYTYEKKDKADDGEVLSIIQKEVKKRKDSIDQYKQGGRDDLVEKEQAQMEVLAAYLPEQMSEEELTSIVESVIAEVGAESKADVGKVMGALMPKIKGKADGGMASKIVNQKLS